MVQAEEKAEQKSEVKGLASFRNAGGGVQVIPPSGGPAEGGLRPPCPQLECYANELTFCRFKSGGYACV